MTEVGQIERKAPEGSNVFFDRFVLYLDFLGVSDAAISWPDERAAQLIEVLKIVAAERAPFDIDGTSQPDGSYKFLVTAETSTFSDHIVASYIFPKDPEIPAEFLTEMYLSLSQDMVARVAVHALNVGLLIRGGLTIGKLYHAGGVVFGEGMIDAYRLENRVASYPRVVVSSRIYDKVPPRSQHRVMQDTDGIRHLDYFSAMTRMLPETERGVWIKRSLATIEQNVGLFEKGEKWNEFGKWSWFGRNFKQLVNP